MAGVRRRQISVLLTFLLGIGSALVVLDHMDRKQHGRPTIDPSSTASPKTLSADWSTVRILLHERCVRCHGPAKQKGGLRLDSLAHLLAGGKRGPALEPGRPERSLLIEAIHCQNVDLRMPPARKLPKSEIETFTAWVADRSFWETVTEAHPFSLARARIDLNERGRHWAFQPLTVTPVPAVRDQRWPRSALDHFVLARFEREGRTPAPPADRRTLLRRVTFDLIGLPPSPNELQAVDEDASPDWYERVVDRLLASPHFGERWGRHWLDLVRFAESRGHEEDHDIPNAFEYRDYVIRAFNADVSLRQLILEHVAGDLLDPPRTNANGWNESVIGTGFWHLGEWLHSPVDTRRDEAERIENQIDVFGKAFLGLTLACARCHDHKYDPVRQEDYCALAGFIKSASYRQVRFETMEREKLIAARVARVRSRAQQSLSRSLADVLQPGIEHFAAYLLAARQVVLAAGTHSIRTADVDAAARANHLSAVILGRLVDDLERARRDPDDVMHLWAQLAWMEEGTEMSRHLQSVREEWDSRDEASAHGHDHELPVIDDPEEWIRDGYAHGLPAHPGDLEIGTDPAWPVTGIVTASMARRDPLWPGMCLSSLTQRDPGKLGEQVRAGQTVRSATFVLQREGLAYLVQGSGRAFVDVDSYRLFVGPLHNQLLLDWKDAGKPNWVWQDLGPYRGHQIHVELTPGPGCGAAVRRVIQCDRKPGPVSLVNGLLRRRLQDGSVSSPEALAGLYQNLVIEAVARLATDRLVRSVHAENYAQLADWMVRRPYWAEDAAPCRRRRLMDLGREIQAELTLAAAEIPAESRTAVALLDGSPADMPLMIRGEPERVGPSVPRRFLEVYEGPAPFVVPTSLPMGSGRLHLAHRLTESAAPLIARVMVNRIWHHLFGQGIVATVDNLGLLGDAPADIHLLDHLASDFIGRGWSIKAMIREIVLSQTYRMASDPCPDEQGLSVHRRDLRRLDAEAIRDAILATSGSLDRRLYGPSVPVAKLSHATQDRGPGGPLDGNGRRSIYLAIRRLQMPPFLQSFDFPSATTTIGQRDVSIVPAQCLTLMNDPFVSEQAQRWAERLIADGPATPSARIEDLYRRAFARDPSSPEMSEVVRFLKEQAARYGLAEGWEDDVRLWTDLIHALINAKEFIHVR